MLISESSPWVTREQLCSKEKPRVGFSGKKRICWLVEIMLSSYTSAQSEKDKRQLIETSSNLQMLYQILLQKHVKSLTIDTGNIPVADQTGLVLVAFIYFFALQVMYMSNAN